MDKRYLNKLSKDNLAIIQELENHTQLEIEMVVDKSRSCSACEFDLDSLKIIIPGTEAISEVSLWHELTHLKRFCSLDIPSLVECPGMYTASLQTSKELTAFDNEMEHLNIVPEEINRFENRQEYWESRYERAIAVNNLSREKALRHWLFLHIVLPKSRLISEVDVLINRMQISDYAEKLIREIIPLLNNKEEMVRAYFSQTKSSMNSLCFEYKDYATRTKRHTLLDVSMSK